MDLKPSHLPLIKMLVFVFAGVIFPVFMLGASAYNLYQTSNQFKEMSQQQLSIKELNELKNIMKSPYDYGIISIIYMEKQAHKIFIHKQTMKIASMYIGYAVLSVGVMMLFLGIETKKQNDINGNFMGLTFNIKSGSGGIIIFLLGASMIIIPGSINNKYQTPGIPGYGSGAPSNISQIKNNVLYIYQQCNKQTALSKDQCFTQSINSSFKG